MAGLPGHLFNSAGLRGQDLNASLGGAMHVGTRKGSARAHVRGVVCTCVQGVNARARTRDSTRRASARSKYQCARAAGSFQTGLRRAYSDSGS